MVHPQKKLPVLSGYPQESVLGPLLFLIYLNDLPETSHSSFYLLADDSKLVWSFRWVTDASRRHQHPGSVHSAISRTNYLLTPKNVLLCAFYYHACLSLTKYYINALTSTTLMVHQSIVQTRVKTWVLLSTPTSNCCKANKSLNLIKHIISPHIHYKTLLYISLVRAQFSYCSQLLMTQFFITDIVSLETMQRCSTNAFYKITSLIISRDSCP